MLFTELRFLVFFAVVLCVHWALRSNRARKNWLLVASYVFYGAWDWRFLSLIVFSTVVDYSVGRALGRSVAPRARRLLLVTSLVANLGLLGFFKYFNFFIESATGLFDLFGMGLPVRTLEIVLPVGISFYTFQTLSYTIDIYRGHLRPIASLVDFALFVSFFPQLVAGPIVRSSDFLPQLKGCRRFRDVNVRACLSLFLYGFIKKAVVSDNFAAVIDPVFADPAAFDTWSTWLTLLLWHCQIYCDFSGYSDMAIATAGLLGYRLPLNFDFPYFSRSLEEFWTRWHITLSSWLRDYLYTPLRKSGSSGAWALTSGVVTMMACGIWHGAGWQYVGFGVLMSSAIVVARVWRTWVPASSAARRVVTLMGPLILTWFLFVNWIVFRSEGWSQCTDMLAIFLFLEPGGALQLDGDWLLAFLACAALHVAAWRGLFARLGKRIPDWGYACLYGLSLAAILPWVATTHRAFIYFQF